MNEKSWTVASLTNNIRIKGMVMALPLCFCLYLDGCMAAGETHVRLIGMNRELTFNVEKVFGIPMYPGATVFHSDKENGRLVYVSMITDDPPKFVENFYLNNIHKFSGGWKSRLSLDGMHFWLGGLDPDPYGTLGAPTMDVRVSPLHVRTKSSPEAKTMISIQRRTQDSETF